MDITPQILTAKVYHKRFFPKMNAFSYGVFNICLPLPAAPLPSKMMSFNERDHGARDGSSLETWVRGILQTDQLDSLVKHITVVTMPRVFGYTFNPVSFYLCLDENKQCRAVLAQVHNTFGEAHSYLCFDENKEIITKNTVLETKKLFHVSPFLERIGSYRFNFSFENDALAVKIDYYDENQQKQLTTSIAGKLAPLTEKSLRVAFYKHPLVTLKVITLIHWQAVKLFVKGIKVITKPIRNVVNLSITEKNNV